MHLLKQRSTVFYVGFVLIMTMAIGGMAFGAFAAGGTGTGGTCTSTDGLPGTPTPVLCGTPSTTNASATIDPGTLSETADPSATVPAFTLNGTDHPTSYSFNINVIDARGTGAGWNLMMSATKFTDGTHPVSVPYSVSAVTATCIPTCSASGGTKPASIADPTLGLTKIWSANGTGEGMGSWTVTPSVSFTIPANTYAGTYASSVTVDLIAGP